MNTFNQRRALKAVRGGVASHAVTLEFNPGERKSVILKANKLIFLALLLSFLTPVAEGQVRRGRRLRKPRAAAAKPSAPCPPSPAITTASGLTYLIMRRGEGKPLRPGETVTVHYTGLLSNGTKFDSSVERGEPISFELGAGRVIKGWDEGIAQLRIGDQATLIIPPQLGYGTRGAGNGVIPPDATLVFLVEVIGTKEALSPAQ